MYFDFHNAKLIIIFGNLAKNIINFVAWQRKTRLFMFVPIADKNRQNGLGNVQVVETGIRLRSFEYLMTRE